MPTPETQKIVDRIGRMLEGESAGNDTAALFAAIEKINHRLDKLELPPPKEQSYFAAILSHPSLHKFHIDDAAGANTKGAEKACTLEPSGKPCDQCSMCNSRGF